MPIIRDFLSFEAILNPIAVVGVNILIATPAAWYPKNNVEFPKTWATAILFVVALVLWYVGALKEQKSRLQNEQTLIERNTNKELRQDIIVLSTNMSAWFSNLPDDIKDILNYAKLSDLTNDALRLRALSHCQKMRKFELEIRNDRSSLFSPVNINQTQEQRNMAWQIRSAEMINRSNEQHYQFRTDYLPEALALEKELARRLNRPIDRQDHNLIALRHGALAGVSPVSDAADHIEGMAREL